MRYILAQVTEKCAEELNYLQVELPVMVERTPTISLREAQKKISLFTNKPESQDKDLNPEDERLICKIIKEETGSDFVYVYGYPTREKPFYVYPNPKDPSYNEAIDLLCRGVEWLSGGRRINDYQQLENHVAQWGMDPSKLTLFLEAFRYGVPPEGGFAFGAERMTMQILGLTNIREASMFPRDLNRIDTLLSEQD